ncbi:MAG: class I SAM-dependent methyltransferase [Flavisolibacter sp.]
MQQALGKFLMFSNRLEKQYRHMGKQARKQGIGCFRVYDHDLPEFPFMIEVYEDKLYVAEYKRRHNLSEDEHEVWMLGCRKVMVEVIGIPDENIFIRTRQRKEGRLGQYQKLDAAKNEFIVTENGLKFIINLSDYLDTGLFLDHRITRQMIKELSERKKILNLFCYTGSFSVYAAAGQATKVVSVDLSKTYLDWADRNMKVNFPDFEHEVVHADVMQYLGQLAPGSFDLIVLDPPTFSNSKRMEDFLDIQRDHVQLINDCINLLSINGIVFFSTNFTKFKLDEEKINASEIKDITKRTTPFDFAGKLKRQCFRITR